MLGWRRRTRERPRTALSEIANGPVVGVAGTAQQAQNGPAWPADSVPAAGHQTMAPTLPREMEAHPR